MQLLVAITFTTKTWQINIPRQLSQTKTKRSISGSEIYHSCLSVFFTKSILYSPLEKGFLIWKKKKVIRFISSYFLKCKLYIQV